MKILCLLKLIDQFGWVGGKIRFHFLKENIIKIPRFSKLPSEKLLCQASGIPRRQLHSTKEFSSTEHHSPGWVRKGIRIKTVDRKGKKCTSIFSGMDPLGGRYISCSEIFRNFKTFAFRSMQNANLH